MTDYITILGKVNKAAGFNRLFSCFFDKMMYIIFVGFDIYNFATEFTERLFYRELKRT